MTKPQQDQEYSEKETAARRDATIKRMITMPPKPHSEMKVGKGSQRNRVAKQTKKTAHKKRKK